jgi:hypothetical protein
MVWPFSRSDPSPYLPGPEPPKKDEPPAYVPMERFNQALDEVKGLSSKLDQFTGLMTGFLGNPSPSAPPRQGDVAPQEVPIDDITDEEYSNALLSGDAAKISKRNKAEIERATRGVKREYDIRLKTLEGQGMAILDQVNTEQGQQALSGQPYYHLLKGDIDAQLKTIPAHQRTPEMRQWVYERTVGANQEKVWAFKQAEEARIKQERDALGTPGRESRDKDSKPTAANVFGEATLDPTAVWRGGGPLWARRTPDEWARSRYGTKDVNEAAVLATNLLALDDCPRCFGPIIGGKCHCKGRAS